MKVETPDEKILKSIFGLLREDEYYRLQFVPFSNHIDIYKENELPRLIEQEGKILQLSNKNAPVLYYHSLCREYYYNFHKIDKKLELLSDLFLFSNVLHLKEIEELLPKYLNLIRDYVEEVDKDSVRFKYRIVPIYKFLVLADHLNHPSSDGVFLFFDSVALSSYLRNSKEISGTVADVGTGTGILALTVAATNTSRVFAVDVSERALHFAEVNIKANDCTKKIELKKGDLKSLENENIDTIVSNPPYMYRSDVVSTNGGEHFGMEIPLRFIEFAIDNDIKVVMILNAPISSGGNEFEKLLTEKVKIVSKEIVGTNKLYSKIGSHISLIEEGILSQELSIYNLDRNI